MTTFNRNKGLTNSSPCKNCPNRKLACHDTCQKHFAFKLEQQMVKQQIDKYKRLSREASL